MNSSNGSDIYQLLISAIESGELVPGTRLRETELADRFGVSRTPIREALKQLEAHGLARHEANRGMVIPTLDHDEINELYVIRTILEGTAASLAAQHATQAEIDILMDMVEADKANIDSLDDLIETNRLFHKRLTLASHNRYLVSQMAHMKQYSLLLDGTTLDDLERRSIAVRQHEAIVEAISKRDREEAEKQARNHIQAAHRARLEG